MVFLKKKLSNGICVIMDKRDLGVVTLGIANKFGGIYENSEIKGVAHVIEHLLFTGTKNRSHEDISREIEKKGGILNAYTGHEVTNFWFKLPSEHVFSGLDILIDMIKNPKFDETKFAKEKKVILEEIKMYRDNPRLHVFEQIERNLFEKPFGELIIGNVKSVSSLERDFVADLFKQAYVSDNFVVSIVGDADFDEICDYLEKNFENKKGGMEIVKVKEKNAETVEERAGIDQAQLVFAFHAPLCSDKNRYAMEVLDAYIGSGMSSKIFLEVREKRGLAYAIKSVYECGKNYSFYCVYAGCPKDNANEVKEIIIKEFKKVEKEMSEKDLEEAKERLIGLHKINAEEGFGVMSALLDEELAEDAENYYKYEENIRNVTLEDVKKLSNIKEFSSAIVLPK